MFVSSEFCVLSGRGLYYGPIARPEESYRVWRVVLIQCKIKSVYLTFNVLNLK